MNINKAIKLKDTVPNRYGFTLNKFYFKEFTLVELDIPGQPKQYKKSAAGTDPLVWDAVEEIR